MYPSLSLSLQTQLWTAAVKWAYLMSALEFARRRSLVRNLVENKLGLGVYFVEMMV